MSDNEFIEMILLRSCGNIDDPLLERFDRDTIAAVRLDLILNWLLTETTMFADDGRTLESKIICTPAGDLRLRRLEGESHQQKENIRQWVGDQRQDSHDA